MALATEIYSRVDRDLKHATDMNDRARRPRAEHRRVPPRLRDPEQALRVHRARRRRLALRGVQGPRGRRRRAHRDPQDELRRDREDDGLRPRRAAEQHEEDLDVRPPRGRPGGEVRLLVNCSSFLAPMIRPAREAPRCARGDLDGTVSTRACCLSAESRNSRGCSRLLRMRRYAQDRRASLIPLCKQPGRILCHLLMHTGTGTHKHSNGEGAVDGHPVRCAHKSTL